VLGAGDLGHRVVVRYRTPDGPTDVLGELAAFDEDRLVVRTEAGENRIIARSDVVAGKPVGPRPARYSEMIALERVADRAWPAPEVEFLGEWRLRAADGWTNRANSALPLGTTPGTLDEAAADVERFYRSRGLPPKITVPLPVRRDVARRLEATGWVAQPTVLVQAAPVGALLADAPAVDLRERPSTECLALYSARTHGLPPAAMHVLLAVPAVRFAEARDPDGALVATARGAVVDGYLHIGGVEVVPRARRRGLARAMSAALAQWAVDLGATRTVLQVQADNEPAVRLYAGLGFTTHHTYVTYHR
jgi:ribosomal protein S18 acetylase RimI-like enzyme